MFPDRQRVDVGVTGVSCASANWEATLPVPGGDACDIPPPRGLCASMVVYRCQEAPIGRLTREKDVFFLGADFDVPGAKCLPTRFVIEILGVRLTSLKHPAALTNR